MHIDIQTDHFHIRTVLPSDKDAYMSLRIKTSDVEKAYDLFPDFLEYTWEKVLKNKDEISMMVFQKEDNAFVAICNFQDFQDDHVEIGYDVKSEYRGKGIGTKLVIDLVALAHTTFPGKEVITRIRDENRASCRVAEKAGGILIRREPTPEAKLIADVLEKYSVGKLDKLGFSASEDQIMTWEKEKEDGKDKIRVYRMPCVRK